MGISWKQYQAMKEERPIIKKIEEYVLITISILIVTIGIYFFKFPNHFAFGGVTGWSVLVSQVTPLSSSDFTFMMNMALLVIGFLFLGKDVGFKTVYASVLMSVGLSFLERHYPLAAPLTQEPMLELIYAIFLPAIGSAVLFNIGASSGGTDIIAMILRKYTRINIGTALTCTDIVSVLASFLIAGPANGLYSCLGLLAKSFVIDGVIENINLCKCFTIICDHPEPICEFIIQELNRSATVYEARGAFSHHEKTIILTTMRRGQAIKLRNYIKQVEPKAFILLSNSSEIIGKGFLTI